MSTDDNAGRKLLFCAAVAAGGGAAWLSVDRGWGFFEVLYANAVSSFFVVGIAYTIVAAVVVGFCRFLASVAFPGQGHRWSREGKAALRTMESRQNKSTIS
jgi:hypothetical protein